MSDAPAAPVAATPKVKKVAAKKAAKPKVAAAHPPFAAMITAAVKALKERNGSSRQAILKYVLANYKVGDAAKAQVRVKLALKKLVAAKKLIAGGAAGKKGAGCFKVPVAAKAEKPKKVAKKPAAKKAAKKPAAKKAAKKPAAKKPAAKKPAAKKPAAKKPAAKKPAAKKPAAKKAAAKK
ncbi:histone H1-delta [Eurytemora carolleeae]|uniref:histone H1-delta n=1 Tax=Eurytemora carolleeae TaxID=1294199 RepID=UPI000C777A43|nr:histone H1-delta [Eurytemora carolleeae]|eukprot:XP_023327155.1 histone H1-delta-like [Eurytemora affinis]